jgi:hypothetical protein
MRKYSCFLWFILPVGLPVALGGASAQADTWNPFPPAPQYKVEAVEFHCNDEVGYDEPWFAPWISDEVRIGIGTPTTTTISGVFTDVDSGETRSFAPEQSCIHPIAGQGPAGNGVFPPSSTWSCSARGAAGPISFTVVMVEEDSGFLHDCMGGFPFGGCSFYSDERPADPNDDVIGRRKLEFTPEQLAAAMPNVGDTLEETIKIGPEIGESGTEGHWNTSYIDPDPAEYTFTYRITRVAVGPLLSEGRAPTMVPPPTR